MAVAAPEQSAITEVVQLYIDGSRSGDADKLRQAFHPDARMYGSLAGQRLDLPIDQFFDLASKQPADVDGTYEARIVSVEQVGGAATAVIEETGSGGRCRSPTSSRCRVSTASGRSSTRPSRTPAGKRLRTEHQG
jgi:hypothetical protein